MPGFSAELGLPRSVRPHGSAPTSKAATGNSLVSPEQTLFPPGTPVYACSPWCTWGPPMVQTCCAEICFSLPFVGQFCFPTCFTQMAPRCPT
jgi:hypothetical protein